MDFPRVRPALGPRRDSIRQVSGPERRKVAKRSSGSHGARPVRRAGSAAGRWQVGSGQPHDGAARALRRDAPRGVGEAMPGVPTPGAAGAGCELRRGGDRPSPAGAPLTGQGHACTGGGHTRGVFVRAMCARAATRPPGATGCDTTRYGRRKILPTVGGVGGGMDAAKAATLAGLTETE